MNEEVDFIVDSAKEDMGKAITHLEKALLNIRAGKASPAMLGGVMVDYYGSQTPLTQVANVNTPDARTISVQPWEKQMIPEIEKGMNTKEVWRDIRDHDGSVQHLDFLTQEEKDVFKTYSELDQLDIIYQAANRQNHLDQGQSVNIIVHPDMPVKEINNIHMKAWELGLKSLYYQHSMNAAQKFKQKKECASCEA